MPDRVAVLAACAAAGTAIAYYLYTKKRASGGEVFGTGRDGDDVLCYTLSHGGKGIRVQVITLGATLTSLLAPDQSGALGEVLLGFDDAAPYHDGTSPYFGCVAGRVANRIAKGMFAIDDKQYRLVTNNGPNHLHGGTVGFDKRNWKCTAASATSVTLQLRAADGEEGYPGKLLVSVTYSLPTPTSLRIEYSASTDATTPCNLTNHAYWNLKDGGASAVFGHDIEVAADFYTPVDDTSIPTGEIRAVSGAMDLRAKATIADHGLSKADQGMGYDHNWCLRQPTGRDGLRPCARVYEPSSGRVMVVRTSEPGVQFYTGNYLDGVRGRGGTVSYGKHHGFCLETQHFPDSVNFAHFPPVWLSPGMKYKHVTEHAFACSKTAPVGEY